MDESGTPLKQNEHALEPIKLVRQNTIGAAYARNWCFTKHFGGPGQHTREEAYAYCVHLADDATYICFGEESAPTTGQLHFQGYVQFEVRKRLAQLVKAIPQCHWEVARGDHVQNIAYCSKGGKFEELGEVHDTTGGKQGREAEQARWRDARVAAVKGDFEAVPDQIYVQHYSAIVNIAKDHLVMPKDNDGPCGLWIWGPPGVGKSRKARELCEAPYFKLANKWFDGFDVSKHKEVILDDFDKVHGCLAYHLKIWADRYAFIGEIKGGAIAMRPSKFVVTSNYSPDDIWQDDETLGPIRRRFKVLHMAEPFAELTNRENQDSGPNSTGDQPSKRLALLATTATSSFITLDDAQKEN